MGEAEAPNAEEAPQAQEGGSHVQQAVPMPLLRGECAEFAWLEWK